MKTRKPIDVQAEPVIAAITAAAFGLGLVCQDPYVKGFFFVIATHFGSFLFVGACVRDAEEVPDDETI